MRCANSLMLWCLQKMQEYWWYVEAFCKRPERKELVQIAGENRLVLVIDCSPKPPLNAIGDVKSRAP